VGIRVVQRYDPPRDSGGKRVRPRPVEVLLLIMTPVLICYGAAAGWTATVSGVPGRAPVVGLLDVRNVSWGLVSCLVAIGSIALGALLIIRGLSRGAAATLGLTYAVGGMVLGLASLILVFLLLAVDRSNGLGWVAAAFGLMFAAAITLFGWNLAMTNRALCLLLPGPEGVGRGIRLGSGWRMVVLVGPDSDERAAVVIETEDALAKSMVRVSKLTRSPFGPRILVCRAGEKAWRPTATALAWACPVIIVDVSKPTSRLVEDLDALRGWRGGRNRNSILVCTQEAAEVLASAVPGDATPTARLAALLDGRDVLAYDERDPARRREFVQSLRNRVDAVLAAPSRLTTVTATPSPVDVGWSDPDIDDGT
jgi:hypothetical protein